MHLQHPETRIGHPTLFCKADRISELLCIEFWTLRNPTMFMSENWIRLCALLVFVAEMSGVGVAMLLFLQKSVGLHEVVRAVDKHKRTQQNKL